MIKWMIKIKKNKYMEERLSRVEWGMIETKEEEEEEDDDDDEEERLLWE